MTEHEQLKWMSDLIGYMYNNGIHFDRKYKLFAYGADSCKRFLDVREIIFTTEFMEKFWEYYAEYNQFNIDESTRISISRMGIYNHLDNPTQYLYNLLKKGHTN